MSLKYTVFPRSSDPFYVVIYYIKWVTTSWTYRISLIDIVAQFGIDPAGTIVNRRMDRLLPIFWFLTGNKILRAIFATRGVFRNRVGGDGRGGINPGFGD